MNVQYFCLYVLLFFVFDCCDFLCLDTPKYWGGVHVLCSYSSNLRQSIDTRPPSAVFFSSSFVRTYVLL